MKKRILKMCAVLLAITCFVTGIASCEETLTSSNDTQSTTASENNDSSGSLSSESGGMSDSSSSSSSTEEEETLPKTVLYLGGEKTDYGYTWLENLIDAFEEEYAKTSFENGKKGVKIMFSAGDKSANNDILCIHNDSPTYVKDITDVLTENGLVDKLLLQPCEKDGRYYTLPYIADTYGIVYNSDLFEEKQWKVPNTTTELFALCEQMQEENVPFIAAGDDKDKYWRDMVYAWWGQYEGTTNYQNFWNGVNASGTYSKDIFAQNGRLQALTAMESLINEEYLSTSTYDWRTTAENAAREFLYSSASSRMKTIAMFPYGEGFDKLYNAIQEEDESIQLPELGMMKVPVISSIIQQCTTIDNDQMLLAVIDAIDRGETSYGDVSTTDFTKIKNARAVMAYATTVAFSLGANCNSLNAAKEFLTFAASEEGFAVAVESGVKPALEYSLSTTQRTYLGKLQNEAINISKTAVYLPIETHKILYRVGVFCDADGIPFSVGNCIDEIRNKRKTAKNIYDETIAYYTQQKFEETLNWYKSA